MIRLGGTVAAALLALANPPRAWAGAAPAPDLSVAARALGQGDFATARQVAAAVRAGASDPALALRARLIEGVAARGEGDFAGSAEALDFPAAPGAGLLDAYRWYYLADARFYLGDFARAAAGFERARALAKVPAFAARAEARIADAQLASGDPCSAAASLREVQTAPDPAAALDALARADEGCGHAGDAAAERHRLWSGYPEHPAAQALEAQEGARATAAERLQRGTDLLAQGEPPRALAEADLALQLEPAPEARTQAELLRGKALAALGRGAEATASLRRASGAKRFDAAAEAQTLLAREDWRLGRFAEAEKRLQGVAASRPRDRAGDDAAFLYAFVPFDRGRYAEAAARFAAFLKARPRAKRADDAAWFAAYAALRLGDHDRARAGFAHLVRAFPASPLIPQALYWQARISDSAAAQPLYRAAVRSAPLGYYAALAREHLAELHAAPEPEPPRAALPAAPPRELDDLSALARALSEAGLWPERGEALDAAGRSAGGPEQAEVVAALAASLGEWGRAYALANGRLWHRALEEKDPGALALLFPRTFPDEVAAAAKAYQLDPSFVWAIMRRESSFDPRATSPVRAAGLMQLLVPTARKIAALLGRAAMPTADALHDPDRAIPLATWYLAELVGRFGHAGLAAAAYNAGPRAVTGWLTKNGSMPFDAFVEAIPFRETRLYVKAVLGDYFAYRALYRCASPPLPTGAAVPPARPGVAF